MKIINAFGEKKEITNKKPLKPNIKGKITKANKNYTKEDLEYLDPVIPLISDFDEPMVKQNRTPETIAPDRLPTADLPFYPMDEHNLIGQFESKQNIYLNLAHFCNKLASKIEALEAEVAKLKNVK